MDKKLFILPIIKNIFCMNNVILPERERGRIEKYIPQKNAIVILKLEVNWRKSFDTVQPKQ